MAKLGKVTTKGPARCTCGAYKKPHDPSMRCVRNAELAERARVVAWLRAMAVRARRRAMQPPCLLTTVLAENMAAVALELAAMGLEDPTNFHEGMTP